MQKSFRYFGLIAIFLLFSQTVFSKNQTDRQNEAVEKTDKFVSAVINNSFPELEKAKIKIKTFESESNYFKAQFSYTRYLTFQKMRYTIYVNPEVYRRAAPETGIRAILAHELAHILYYRRKNRLQFFGLLSLTDKSFTAKFERKADLEAISRGYGNGLIEYRNWLYKNIPAKVLQEKKRNYFSPEEIRAIMKKPEKIDFWRKNVPRNLEDISKTQ